MGVPLACVVPLTELYLSIRHSLSNYGITDWFCNFCYYWWMDFPFTYHSLKYFLSMVHWHFTCIISICILLLRLFRRPRVVNTKQNRTKNIKVLYIYYKSRVFILAYFKHILLFVIFFSFLRKMGHNFN